MMIQIKRLQLEKKLIWLTVLFSVFVICTNSISDADFWWHLKTGEYIWQTKSVPKQDVFSHTAYGKEWVVHEWLAQVTYFLIYRAFGFLGIVFFVAGLSCLLFFLLWQILLLLRVSNVIASVVVFISAFVGTPFLIPRPQMFMFLFMVVLTYILFLFHSRKKWVLLLLPFLFLIWANFHASTLLALGIIILFVLGDLFFWLIQKNIRQKSEVNLIGKDFLWLGLATFLAVGFSLLNPNFFQTYTYIFKISSVLRTPEFAITEWTWLYSDPSAYQVWLFTGYFLVAVTLSVFALRKGLEEKLVILATLTLPLIVAGVFLSRYLPIALLFCTLSLGYSVSLLFKAKNWKIEVSWGWAFILSVVFLIGAILYHYELGRPLKEAEYYFPKEVVEFVLENDLTGEMYNPYSWGGYFVWRLFPKYKTFIDGRFEMFIPEVFQQFNIIETGVGNWEEVLDSYRVNFLIFPFKYVHPNLATSPNWVLVYFDDQAAVFVKNDEKNQKVIEQHEYKYIRPFVPELFAPEDKREEAIAEYQEALEKNPDMFRANFDLGVIYLMGEEYKKAGKHFAKAKEIFPQSIYSHYYLAVCLEKLGYEQEAMYEYFKYEQLKK